MFLKEISCVPKARVSGLSKAARTLHNLYRIALAGRLRSQVVAHAVRFRGRILLRQIAGVHLAGQEDEGVAEEGWKAA